MLLHFVVNEAPNVKFELSAHSYEDFLVSYLGYVLYWLSVDRESSVNVIWQVQADENYVTFVDTENQKIVVDLSVGIHKIEAVASWRIFLS